MPDDNDLPQATVERRRGGRISVVWLIPILAAVVAIGIAVQVREVIEHELPAAH